MSNPLLRTLGRTSFRAVYSILGGLALALWGTSRGWPWWVAVPAAILATVAVFMALISALYAYTKVSYPARAEEIRARTTPCRSAEAVAERQSAGGTEAFIQKPCAQDRPDHNKATDATQLRNGSAG